VEIDEAKLCRECGGEWGFKVGHSQGVRKGRAEGVELVIQKLDDLYSKDFKPIKAEVMMVLIELRALTKEGAGDGKCNGTGEVKRVLTCNCLWTCSCGFVPDERFNKGASVKREGAGDGE